MNLVSPQITGIAGGSCSDKTTLLAALEEHYKDSASYLSFDEYFVGTAKLGDTNITDWESPTLYNYTDFIHDLKAMKRGETVVIETHSRESDEKGYSDKTILPKPFIFIERFLIFHEPEARDCFDKKIFIELPEDEIVRRRLARSKGTSKWNDPEYITQSLIPGHRKYIEPQREFADLILDGTEPTSELIAQILEYLPGKLV